MKKSVIRAALLLIPASLLFFGAETYQKPPKAIEDILNSPTTPTLSLSPNHAYAIQGSPVRYPPISELSEPMLRLAGIRINPKTNGLHNTTFQSNLVLRKIPEGTEIKIALPPNPKLSAAHWSPDGSHFAFTNSTAAGTEIWIGDTATGRTHKLPNVRVNEVFGGGGGRGGGAGGRGGGGGGSLQWLADNKSLLVHAVRANRGAPPAEPTVPDGPHIQESLGGGKGAPTYEDLLQNPHDEDLFEYYATSQLAVVDSVSGAMSPIGKPVMIESAEPSPDGKNFIVHYIHKPFSYSYTARQFPTEIEIWDRTGKMLKKEASIPLGGTGRGAGAAAAAADEENPVAAGPRGLNWLATEPATLIWFEGTGGRGGRGRGGAAASADASKPPEPVHDKIMGLKAPFSGTAQQIYAADTSLEGFTFTENLHTAIVDGGGGGRGGGGGGGGRGGAGRATTAYLIDFAKPTDPPKPLWTRGGARYNDPGRPMEKTLPNGARVVILDGDNVFLQGNGASANGDHPFLSRYNLATKESTPLFKCDDDHYESVDVLLDAHGEKFLTRRESPTEPPNYYVRSSSGQLTAMTNYPDPQPIMRKVHKELVTYKRPDGVEMSFTLYLPPDYTPGGKPLPTILWAYPYEYETADDASGTATNGSRMRFTEIGGYSEIFFALDGYAVLDNASMPIVGPRASVNDHFLDQLLMDAKAAVDKAVEMGVTDRDRVGVGGHSYGAYMTDNLLAHSDLFKAGIAESGAPNRTLTPFGFQNERRTLWDDPDLYIKMSPFMFANKIKNPLLLIHGEADDNTGTFPIQSERMYEAVRGNGGTVRLVFLPSEAHGYRAKETIEHVNWEKLRWFDKFVKDPPPPNLRGTATPNNEKNDKN
jgi:dipeptidyl aminopeptidase/acylaminoacyl peptidase